MTPETVASGCVDESTLVRFFAGDLPMDRLTAVEFHLDACQDCARLIEAAAPLLAGVSGPGRLLAMPAEVEPGQLVAGRYRIEGLIGQGATGYVLRARDELAGVPVAVKLLRSERAAQPALMQLFTRELRVARALNHPHVCRVFDLQTSGEDRFLVMELAEGSLRDELRSGGTAERTLDQRLSDGEAIAAGLGAIHDAGIVHRDVKPENVLRLGDGRLVLSDFGLATLTPLGSATRYVGTPLYMAPEVAAGEPATRASDLYSLGLVLHELFFGRRPEWHASGGRRVRKDPPRRGCEGLGCRAEGTGHRPADGPLPGGAARAAAGRRAGGAAPAGGDPPGARGWRCRRSASCNRRSWLALSAAHDGGGRGCGVRGRRRDRVDGQPPVAAGRLDPLPRSLLFERAWRASFSNTDVGLAVVNRSPGTGFDLVDLRTEDAPAGEPGRQGRHHLAGRHPDRLRDRAPRWGGRTGRAVADEAGRRPDRAGGRIRAGGVPQLVEGRAPAVLLRPPEPGGDVHRYPELQPSAVGVVRPRAGDLPLGVARTGG